MTAQTILAALQTSLPAKISTTSGANIPPLSETCTCTLNCAGTCRGECGCVRCKAKYGAQ